MAIKRVWIYCTSIYLPTVAVSNMLKIQIDFHLCAYMMLWCMMCVSLGEAWCPSNQQEEKAGGHEAKKKSSCQGFTLRCGQNEGVTVNHSALRLSENSLHLLPSIYVGWDADASLPLSLSLSLFISRLFLSPLFSLHSALLSHVSSMASIFTCPTPCEVDDNTTFSPK